MEEKTEIKLTPKQEMFCQQYVLLGNKSQAYRNSYDAENMANDTINRKAVEMFENGKITARVEQLQEELQERNRMTLDKTINSISEIANFDIAELYEEDGTMKSIHEIPKHIRTSINELNVLEVYEGTGKDRKFIGYSKKARMINRLDALEKLVKIFGGYGKDNAQKQIPVILTSEERIAKIKKLSEKLNEDN